MRRPAYPPADDPAGIGVDDESDVDEAGPSRDIGEVGEPEHVRGRCMELAVDVIEGARRGLVLHRRADRLAADDAFQAHGLHRPAKAASFCSG